MTFCLGISVEEGLVGIADTRVLSGNEYLTAKKTATYQGPGFSFFVMTSGLRSLRDKILLYFEEAFARETMARERLYRIVNLYARQVRRVSEEDREPLERADLRFNAFSLIGGQAAEDSTHRLFLVYPEGNWPRHAVPDYRRLRFRQTNPRALAPPQGFHAVRLQGRRAGL